MTVKELIKYCYDKILIYEQLENKDFHDLYFGNKNEINSKYLDCEVVCFGAKKESVIEIEILR